MTLRRRLVLVHVAFAAFAVVAAVATIYAVQLQVERSATRFEALVDEMHHLDDCRSDVQSLDVHLHELITGDRAADEDFQRYARSVLTRLGEVARYSTANEPAAAPLHGDFSAVVAELDAGVTRMVELVRAGALHEARTLFKSRIERELLDPLQTRLRQLRRLADEKRRMASLGMLEADSQLLVLAGLIGLGGVALVVTGMLIVRRRLVQPIKALQSTAETFAEGDLSYRLELPVRDELGQLAGAMNGMAAALQRSQKKYRNLFENLRDTVIICDSAGRVRECHDGDAAILNLEAESIVGEMAARVWPDWRFHGMDWTALLARMQAEAHPLRLSDVALPVGPDRTRMVDVVAYRVEYGEGDLVVVALRDVVERHALQKVARRAETMEAAVNFARGIAHDFKNLLHSAQVSLAGICENTQEQATSERAAMAAEACRQAAGLSKRLTRFSAEDEGSPETLSVGETVRAILEALDDDLFAAIQVNVDCDCDAEVFIDRDQLTQIILNLVYNSLEAMPDGGTLCVGTRVAPFANPLTGRPPAPHVALCVRDTGCGIPAEALEHVFEPLFSSKPRSEAGPRGMGLAVVYAAVNHAGGFVQVESTPGQGTTVCIYLPQSQAQVARTAAATPIEDGAGATHRDASPGSST